MIPASKVTPEAINFMARYGRGLICLTLTKERCQRLRLPLMVGNNTEQFSTNFTVSIEAAQGVTTGISAADRALTVQTAVAADATPQDIVMPGHIFPLMARDGGVLTRAGHTEAGCDLGRLAGLEAASVIVEIMNEDGTMARRPDLEVFAQEHGIKLGTVADLIRYRLENEKTIERVSECRLPTDLGEFRLIGYSDALAQTSHFAMVYGELDTTQPVTVRVQMQDVMCDALLVKREDCGWPLRQAMAKIVEQGSGVIVLLHQNQTSAAWLQKVEEMHYQDTGILRTADRSDDNKTYGKGAQILQDLGIKRLRVLGSGHYTQPLAGFDLEICEFVEKDTK
jgi:3,4-dihydroxy 2-butanone 4-phosphate synthase/GTP cyclohydrolase II